MKFYLCKGAGQCDYTRGATMLSLGMFLCPHDSAFDVVAVVSWVMHSLMAAVDIAVWAKARGRVVLSPSGIIVHC